ncbi:MAG: TAXI family TRAP transporter solute-binding subunit [Candidatus Contendobacter sp.]
MKKLALISFNALLLLGTGIADAAEEKFITIGTGGQTGVYYVVGQSICRLINRNEKDHGIKCTAPSTGGSVANLNAIRAGEQDMGIVQSDQQYKALKGQDDFASAGPNQELRAVFAVHPESFTAVARKDAGIKTFDDFKEKRVNIGNPGSGQRATMDVLMKEKGWTNNNFKLASELKASEQAQALCDNKIDVMLYVVGHPNGSIQEATSSCEAVLVPITGKEVDKMVTEFPYFATSVIPGGMYPGSPTATATFGVAATLVSSTKVSAETVYQVVKAVFDNFDRFKKLHPAFEKLQEKDMIKNGLSAPLHEGAIKYYKEKGWM